MGIGTGGEHGSLTCAGVGCADVSVFFVMLGEGSAMQEARNFETRTCPRCGSELYADMSVCYECLYDFSRDVSRRPLTMLPAGGEHMAGEVEGASRHRARC